MAIAGITVLIGLTLLLLGRFQIDVWITPVTETPMPRADPVPDDPELLVPSPQPRVTPASPLLSQATQSPTAPAPPGKLRVSNPTDHPIRLALLAQRSAAATASPPAPYDPPAHWDFAPEEGSSQGLLLSLPEGSLRVKRGDILVAFAQDGSRLYWGPYVVGATAMPVWNPHQSEWQLIFKP
ncbi:hypothetical protein DO97_14540 [Neosynechococcus sphagnicola sy1]|uniref:Uncharacterized protein n=1 Tax=Neosynechococcus sphagnicola sy1 TaxID=1497020 RepID=A0A098TLZ0_9CYAN|nr:hypothetical protein DO97_14540 [Neosynechococcus sphagnicola sy1]